MFDIDLQVQQISAQKPVQDDILQRYKAIGHRLVELRLENDETWKTMEATEKALNDMITGRNYDVTTFFQDENPAPKSPHEAAKQRNEWLEMEAYYLKVSLSPLYRSESIICTQQNRNQNHGGLMNSTVLRGIQFGLLNRYKNQFLYKLKTTPSSLKWQMILHIKNETMIHFEYFLLVFIEITARRGGKKIE